MSAGEPGLDLVEQRGELRGLGVGELRAQPPVVARRDAAQAVEERRTGVRYEPMRVVGRAAGLLGPGCTTDDVRRWLARHGVADVTIDVSGPMGYFRGVRRA